MSMLIILTGCFADENAIDHLPAEQVTLTTDSDSADQIFYSFRDRKVISKNSLHKWDLAFECRFNGFDIFINSGHGMKVYNTRIQDFRVSLTPTDLPWEKDRGCGDLNLMCIGEWGDLKSDNPLSHKYLYILDLGVDEAGYELGYKKFLVAGFTDGSYLIRYSDINGENEHLKLIEKDTDYNFVYFSIAQGGRIVKVEPPKDQWDILFTPFIDFYSGETGPEDVILNDESSLIYGLISNPSKIETGIDSTNPWDKVTYFDTENVSFSRHTNAIGKNWYDWSNALGEYKVRSTLFFVRDDGTGTYLLRINSFVRDKRYSTISFQFKNL